MAKVEDSGLRRPNQRAELSRLVSFGGNVQRERAVLYPTGQWSRRYAVRTHRSIPNRS